MKYLLVCSLAASGCAAGYGVGYKSHSISAGDTGSSLTYENSPAKVSGFYQELRVIDSTGLLLAALVNAGRQHNAREDAMEQAKYQRPDQEGMVTVEYSYEPMPILSGLLTDLRFRFGLGEPNLEVPAGTDAMGGEVSFWELDLRPEFYTFRPIKRLPVVSSLFLGMIASSVDTANLDVDRELDYFSLDLTAGASTTYIFTPNLMATGRVALGFLSPLLSSIVGGSLLHPSGEVEVGWRPLQTSKVGVMISGTAGIAREWIASPRTMTTTRLGVGVTLTFGSQTPKAARTTETPQPAAATTTMTPDSVCTDPQSPCRQVELNAPPEVKAAFQDCARASIQADRTGTAGDQPQVCRRSAVTIANYYKANQATLTPEMKTLVDVAATGTFALAQAGFNLTVGPNSADSCAMTEQMFNHVVRSVKAEIGRVNAAVTECRKQWTCTATPDGDMACAAR